MTGTSVKLSKRGKARLDQLQARLARLGYRFTKQRLLELLIENGKPGDIIGRAHGAHLPIPEKVIQEIIDSAEDWGPTSWRDIDRLVYGGDLRR